MPDSVSLTFRPLYLEDLSQATAVGFVQDTILGLGPGINVSPFYTASGDAGAAAIGLRVGDVYIDTSVSPSRLRTRMS